MPNKTETIAVARLREIAERALEDAAFAEKVFAEPDAVASEYGLSAPEHLVVKHMGRAQLDRARKDGAQEHAAADRARAAHPPGAQAQSADRSETKKPPLDTMSDMIRDMFLGRAILEASGITFGGSAGNGCKCCNWTSAIATGKVPFPGP